MRTGANELKLSKTMDEVQDVHMVWIWAHIYKKFDGLLNRDKN